MDFFFQQNTLTLFYFEIRNFSLPGTFFLLLFTACTNMKRVFFLSILQTKENKNYTFFVRTKPFRPENDLTIGLINIAVSINQVFHSSLFRYLNF